MELFGSILLVLLGLFLVFLNGFFVLVEFAIVKVRGSRIEALARAGNPRATIARGMIRKLDDYLAATQLGITLASLGLGWLGEPAFARLIQHFVELPGIWDATVSHTLAFGAAFLLITFLHILVGELAPKSIAIQHAERAALWAARPMLWFYRLFYVPLKFLNGSAQALLRLFHISPASKHELAHSEEEMKILLGESQRQGIFSFNHLLLLENAFDFGDRTVRNILQPIDQAIWLSPQDPWPTNLEKIRTCRFSRYPLYDRTQEKYVGMIHFKDVGNAALSGVPVPDLTALRRELMRIDPEARIEALLREFQQRRTHFALVEEKDGKPVGIVTLEDVIEELVGNIEDEFERKADTRLSPWIRRDTIVLDLKASGRRQAIEALLEAIAKKYPELDRGEALQVVWERERSIPTGLAEGVAIPHGRVKSLSKPAIALGLCRQGIDFRAGDGKPARVIFLILTPIQDAHAQVRLMARVAALAGSEYLRQKLLDAKTVEEAIDAVRAADSDLSI